MAQDGQIPVVKQYKYLGFPYGHKSICAKDLMQRMHKSFLAAFLTIKDATISAKWPEPLKINIYKTMIRSTAEYGANIATLMSESTINKKTINDGIKAIQSIQKSCIWWIFDRTRATKTLEKLRHFSQ